MRFTCALCPTCTNTAGGILAHAVTAHPETGELPTTWPHGRDVEVETAVGQEVTHIKTWRREDFR